MKSKKLLSQISDRLAHHEQRMSSILEQVAAAVRRPFVSEPNEWQPLENLEVTGLDLIYLVVERVGTSALFIQDVPEGEMVVTVGFVNSDGFQIVGWSWEQDCLVVCESDLSGMSDPRKLPIDREDAKTPLWLAGKPIAWKKFDFQALMPTGLHPVKLRQMTDEDWRGFNGAKPLWFCGRPLIGEINENLLVTVGADDDGIESIHLHYESFMDEKTWHKVSYSDTGKYRDQEDVEREIPVFLTGNEEQDEPWLLKSGFKKL